MNLIKQQIVSRFDRAAPRYDQLAEVQAQIADDLIRHISNLSVPQCILDIGCGTGLLTRLLRDQYSQAKLRAVDASEAMLQALKKNVLVDTDCADFDGLPYADQAFDCAVSSAALQWSQNTQASLNEWLRVVKRGGFLAFATFIKGTLREWDTAWRLIDHPSSVNSLLSLDEMRALSLPVGCQWQQLSVETKTIYHANWRDAISSVRELGAGQRISRRRRPLVNRKIWQSFIDAYETQVLPQGLPLTYEVCYGIIEKK